MDYVLLALVSILLTAGVSFAVTRAFVRSQGKNSEARCSAMVKSETATLAERLNQREAQMQELRSRLLEIEESNRALQAELAREASRGAALEERAARLVGLDALGSAGSS
jgi:DNA-binding transcriptional MerR regulator